MAVSGKVPVGSNSDIEWNYGGKQIGVAGPIECPMGPWAHRAPGFKHVHLSSRSNITNIVGGTHSLFTQWGLSGQPLFLLDWEEGGDLTQWFALGHPSRTCAEPLKQESRNT